MSQPLPSVQSNRARYSSRSKRTYVNGSSKKGGNYFDRSSDISRYQIASIIQKREEEREYLYGMIAGLLKLFLLSIGVVSVLKLGVASSKLLKRNSELFAAMKVENIKFQQNTKKLDDYFTIGGSLRLLEEQEQWIAPDTYRVIWTKNN